MSIETRTEPATVFGDEVELAALYSDLGAVDLRPYHGTAPGRGTGVNNCSVIVHSTNMSPGTQSNRCPPITLDPDPWWTT